MSERDRDERHELSGRLDEMLARVRTRQAKGTFDTLRRRERRVRENTAKSHARRQDVASNDGSPTRASRVPVAVSGYDSTTDHG